MKASLKRLTTLSKVTIFRSLAFSILFLLFYFAVLYMLINSPA